MIRPLSQERGALLRIRPVTRSRTVPRGQIQPQNAPSLVVTLTQLRPDAALVVGANVVSGRTKIGSVVDLSSVERQALARYTNDVGATITATFEGTGIKWLGYRYDDGGKVQVELDGHRREVVDQYGDGRDLPFDWSITGLKPSKHTIRLTLLQDKNPNSKDRYMNVAGFRIISRP